MTVSQARRISGAALIAALTSAAWAGAAEDEMVPNPFYTAWAGFKPGTTATHEETVTDTHADKEAVPDGKDVKLITYKLLEVTPEKAVVETVVVERAFLRTVEAAPTRTTFPAKVAKSEVEAVRGEYGLKAASASVDFQGKAIPGKVYSGTSKKGGAEVDFKLWTAEAVPGGTVRQVRTTRHENKSTETATIVLKWYHVAP